MGNSFDVRVSGTSLFLVLKYTRLKPKIIEKNFQIKKLFLTNFLGYGTTLRIILILYARLNVIQLHIIFVYMNTTEDFYNICILSILVSF